jgi:hypothetical protein
MENFCSTIGHVSPSWIVYQLLQLAGEPVKVGPGGLITFVVVVALLVLVVGALLVLVVLGVTVLPLTQ